MSPISHSTVLVVIRDADNAAEALDQLDALLAPFDANEPLAEPNLIALDEAEVKRAVEWKSEDLKSYDEFVVDGETEIEWTRAAIGEYQAGDPDKGVYRAGAFGYLSTYNPDSRWDWWSLGGRWHGFFEIKPEFTVGAEPLPDWRLKVGPVGKDDGRQEGSLQLPTFDGTQQAILGGSGVFGDPEDENFRGRADLARKDAIDFEAMRNLVGQRADAAYDKLEEATAGLGVPETWMEFLKRHAFESDHDLDGYPVTGTEEEQSEYTLTQRRVLDEARKAYNEIPWVAAVRKAKIASFFGEPIDDFCIRTGGREAYVARQRAAAAGTFAVLLDGKWYEKGRMGWWGMVGDEKDPDHWSTEQAKMVDALPDDVYLAVVDVHI